MTSNKNLLKETLRSRLERGHQKFIEEKLGEGHPLHSAQQVRAANSVIRRDLLANKSLTSSLSQIIVDQRREAGAQAVCARDLGRLDYDQLTESLSGLKDAIDDAKVSLLESAAVGGLEDETI